MTSQIGQDWQTYFLEAGTREMGIDCSILVRTVSSILQKEKERTKGRIEKEFIGSSVWKLVPNTPRMIMIGDKELKTLIEELLKKI